MPRAAGGSEARLIHYELAGRYSIKATESEIPQLDVVDTPPVNAYGIRRSNIVLKGDSRRQPPAEKHVEQETPNPLPAEHHTGEHYPFTDDEENDPEIEDEQ